MADDRTPTEYGVLLDGIDHWSTAESISHRTGIPVEQVQTVLRALRNEDVSEDICRRVDIEHYLLDINSRVFNERAKFAQIAVEMIGKCKPEQGKGPNYTMIYEKALDDAKDRIEDRFK